MERINGLEFYPVKKNSNYKIAGCVTTDQKYIMILMDANKKLSMYNIERGKCMRRTTWKEVLQITYAEFFVNQDADDFNIYLPEKN